MLKQLILAFFLSITPALACLSLPAQAQGVALASETSAVNINTADAELLSKSLVGVGRARAAAIVQYRDDFGPFFSVEDLLEVKGVGQSIVDRNRDRITLE